jgi:hypothetical protein
MKYGLALHYYDIYSIECGDGGRNDAVAYFPHTFAGKFFNFLLNLKVERVRDPFVTPFSVSFCDFHNNSRY